MQDQVAGDHHQKDGGGEYLSQLLDAEEMGFRQSCEEAMKGEPVEMTVMLWLVCGRELFKYLEDEELVPRIEEGDEDGTSGD